LVGRCLVGVASLVCPGIAVMGMLSAACNWVGVTTGAAVPEI
jgi:hypothetical protein